MVFAALAQKTGYGQGNEYDGHAVESIKGRVVRGAAWITASRILVNLIAFVSTVALARLLAPADFGLVAIAATIAAVVNSLSDLPLSSALVHNPSPEEEHFHSAWSLSIVRALIIATSLAALSWPASQIYSDPRLSLIMLVLAASTFIGGFTNPKLVLFTKNLSYFQEFFLQVSQKVVGLAVSLIWALVYKDFWSLIAGLVATQVWYVLFSYIFIKYRPIFSFSKTRELLSFSVWLSLGQAINTLNWRMDQIFIGYFLGKSALGYYTVGDNLALIPTREATTPIAQTLFPSFARMSGDPIRLRAAYERSQTLLTALALPAGVGVALMAEPLVTLSMGTKWLPAVPLIQCLAGVFALQTLSSSVQPLAMAVGQTKRLFQRDLAYWVIRLPLVLIGLFTGGLIGVVYGRSISGLISIGMNMFLVRSILQIGVIEQLSKNIRTILSVVTLSLSVLLTKFLLSNADFNMYMSAALTCLFGAASYCVTMLILWIISGRPAGPEREIIDLASVLYRRLSRGIQQ